MSKHVRWGCFGPWWAAVGSAVLWRVCVGCAGGVRGGVCAAIQPHCAHLHHPCRLPSPACLLPSPACPQPEMCCNVQQYAKGAYLRKAEAEQCQVQSTLLLPLFISPRRSGCVGVLEVVQTSEDMAFVDVASLLTGALEVGAGGCWHCRGLGAWALAGGCDGCDGYLAAACGSNPPTSQPLCPFLFCP